MPLTKEEKQKIIGKFGKTEADTGSPESQISIFSHRISHLTKHLKKNNKDFATQRTLLKIVGKRKRMLNYLRNTDLTRYRKLLEELKLRK